MAGASMARGGGGRYRVVGTHDPDATRAEWIAARSIGVSASDTAAVMGLSPWKSAMDVYLEKIGTSLEEDDGPNEPAEHGKRLEGYVLERFEEATGLSVDTNEGILQSVEFPWLLATPDGFALRDDYDHGSPVDCKTIGVLGKWDDGIPRHILVQLQQQMVVTGRPHAYVAVLAGGRQGMAFRWKEIAADPELQQEIVDVTRAFWQCVQDRVPPAADGSERCSKALARLYPDDSGETIQLGGEWIDRAEELAALKATIKGAEEQRRKIENALKAQLGEATEGVLPNGTRVTWKTETARYKASAERIVKKRKLLVKEPKE